MCMQDHLKVHNGINVNVWEPLRGKMEQIWVLSLLFVSKKTPKTKHYLHESKTKKQKIESVKSDIYEPITTCLS